jgi:hypothetical protein
MQNCNLFLRGCRIENRKRKKNIYLMGRGPVNSGRVGGVCGIPSMPTRSAYIDLPREVSPVQYSTIQLRYELGHCCRKPFIRERRFYRRRYMSESNLPSVADLRLTPGQTSCSTNQRASIYSRFLRGFTCHLC